MYGINLDEVYCSLFDMLDVPYSHLLGSGRLLAVLFSGFSLAVNYVLEKSVINCNVNFLIYSVIFNRYIMFKRYVFQPWKISVESSIITLIHLSYAGEINAINLTGHNLFR